MFISNTKSLLGVSHVRLVVVGLSQLANLLFNPIRVLLLSQNARRRRRPLSLFPCLAEQISKSRGVDADNRAPGEDNGTSIGCKTFSEELRIIDSLSFEVHERGGEPVQWGAIKDVFALI